MTDKDDAERIMGAPISDRDIKVMADAAERLGISFDQLVSSLRWVIEPEPIDYSELSGPPEPKRKRIHDHRPWPVPATRPW